MIPFLAWFKLLLDLVILAEKRNLKNHAHPVDLFLCLFIFLVGHVSGELEIQGHDRFIQCASQELSCLIELTFDPFRIFIYFFIAPVKNAFGT